MREKLIKIQNELNVPKANFNKFGDYYYRSCEDILEALKPLLEREKLLLTITDSIESVGDRNYVKATVTLTDGTRTIETSALAREAVTPKAKTDDSQLTGATSSYARKYALNGMFLIDDTKDSDATNDGKKEPHKDVQVSAKNSNNACTGKQRKLIYLLYKKKNDEEMPDDQKETIRKLTVQKASEIIDKWNKELEIPEKQADEVKDRNDDSAKDEISYDDPEFDNL